MRPSARKLARELWEKGLSAAAVATAVGCSSCTVFKVKAEEGWTRSERHGRQASKAGSDVAPMRRVSDVFMEERAKRKAEREERFNSAVDAYAGGMSLIEATEVFRIDIHLLRAELRARKLMRTRGRTNSTKLDHDRIAHLYSVDNVSVAGLADRFLSTPKAIRRILQLAGVYDGLRVVRESHGGAHPINCKTGMRQATGRIAART